MRQVFLAAFFFVCFIGCGENGIFDTDWGETPPKKPSGLLAMEFPTKNGSSWEYIDSQGNTHILRIDGIKSINGVTHRISENAFGKANIPEEEGQNAPKVTITDFYSANALYIQVNGTFIQAPFPISVTYFTKTGDAYIESAFDAYIEFLDDPIWHQKHFPVRNLWQFPLQVGSEWVVFQNDFPAITTKRKVVADKIAVTVPAGTYNNTYLVEEHAYGADEQPIMEKPNKYWVAPDVGVVKYEYTDFTSTLIPGIKIYELNKPAGIP